VILLIQEREYNLQSLQKLSSEEFKSISELKRLFSANCKTGKIHPPVFGSDAEVNMNIVIITSAFVNAKQEPLLNIRV
jgi:hypothetical protein